jgi:tetratricopeptide (TPR) repeat protein
MALDIYALCPCGSGKKLKFCCANLAEDMERVSRQIESNQPRQALQQLEVLDRRHPNNAWVVTTRALVQIEIGEAAPARDLLRSFLEQNTDHEFATVLYATAVFQADGLDAAKRAIHRAFQRSAKRFPSMVAGLAGAMAAVFQSRGRMLAAREHLALAMRFSPDRERQEIFVKLLEFDNDVQVPYLLRSVHALPSITINEEVNAEAKKALRYASVGSWSTAGDLFEKLATANADQPALWHSVGLCRAWDGEESAAATALHRAAELYKDDAATAVDCETIAQLLDWNTAPDRRARMLMNGGVSSVGRLLTALDTGDRLFRLELPPQSPDGQPLPAAIYQVLDRPKSAMPAPNELTLDTVPTVISQITVFDTDPETKEPAEIDVTGLKGSDFDTAVELAKAAAGEFVTWKDAPEESNEWVPEETLPLTWQWAFPPKTPVALRRGLELARWKSILENVWPTLLQRALQGRTPVEAARDPASRVAVLSSVYVLDAHCLRAGHELDLDGVLARLGIEPLPPYDIQPETSLNSLSPLQWLRLPLDKLSDQQMLSTVNRALLVHHDRFLAKALAAALQRDACRSELDLVRLYQTLADLSRQHGRRDESYRWLDEGRKLAASEPNNFEKVWSWDLRELLTRLEDPSDPGLKPLIDKFVNFYSPKLPQMRPYLEQMFAVAGVPSPWSSGILTPGSTGGTTGGLWTPESESSNAGSGSKLWLPG